MRVPDSSPSRSELGGAGELDLAYLPLKRALRRAAQRLRVQYLLDQLPPLVGRWLPWVVVAVGGLKLARQENAATVVGIAGLIYLLGRLWLRAGQRVSELSAALELDRRSGQGLGLGAALAFAVLPKDSRSGFHELVLEAGLERVRRLDVPDQVPVSLGKRQLVDLLNLAILAGFLALPGAPHGAPSSAPITPEAGSESSSVARGDPSLARTKQRLTALQAELSSEAGHALARDAVHIVEALEQGALERSRALLELGDLERSLVDSADQERALEERLAQRGSALRKASLSRELGEALTQKQWADAVEALERLRERLADESRPMSAGELDGLRRAIDAAIRERAAANEAGSPPEPAPPKSAPEGSSSPQADSQAELRNLEERAESLRQRQSQRPLNAAERQEQQQIERRLSTLRRRARERAEAQTAESELDRQLAEAARALSEEAQRQASRSGEARKDRAAARREASSYVGGASQALNRLQKKVMSDADKKALLRELQRLKEQLQRGGPGAEEAQRALEAFESRARGEGAGDQAGAGQRAGGKKKSGAPGASQGQDAEAEPATSEAGPGVSSAESEASGAEGERPGTAHVAELMGDQATAEPQAALDVSAVARAQEGGETEAETVRRAARVGFRSPAYRQLFQQYEAIEEEVLARDRVPEGYKTRVLRYFDLIEPSRGEPR